MIVRKELLTEMSNLILHGQREITVFFFKLVITQFIGKFTQI